MSRWMIFLAILVCAGYLVAGCSDGSGTTDDAVMPDPGVTGSMDSSIEPGSPTVLWGLYDCAIDPVTGDISAVFNRNAAYTVNIVSILNKNPMYMQFIVNSVEPETDYTGIDMDVSIAHPFPGLTQFDGYDVRGVFMGNGSGTLDYYSDLVYPVYGTDQFMMDNPSTGVGGPDGYTRWFNRTEFGFPQIPLFGYTHGKFASPGYEGSATLCPYKYFSVDLASIENLWSWLSYNPDSRGVFSAGATCSRNYYIRFPKSAGMLFSYAILANWEGTDPGNHPSNAAEAVSISTTIHEGVYYIDPDHNGGLLDLDIGVFDWDSTVVSTSPTESYNIFIESTVLSTVYEFNETDMIPTSSSDHIFNFHVEIPADEVKYLEGNELWVIVECVDADYSNEFGVPNTAWDDPLAAIFRYDLEVLSEPPEKAPVCDVQLVTQVDWPYEGWPILLEFDASASYSPDGEPVTFEWDFDSDGIFGDPFDSGTEDNPTKIMDFDNQEQVCVKVSNIYGDSECCVPVDLTVYPSKNIPLEPGLKALDLGIRESNGDLLILYMDHDNNEAQAWKYLATDYYQTGTFDYPMPTDWFPDRMDVAPTGYASYGIDNRYRVFAPGGGQSASLYLNPWVEVVDISSYNDAGTWTNDLCQVFAGTNNVGQPDEYVRLWWTVIRYPLYDYDSYTWCGRNYNTDTGYSGLNKTFYEWIQGLETDIDGDSIWMLEDPDYYCTNWTRNISSPIFLDFTGEYFGDGTEDSWTDARDLARTPDNRFLVLEFDAGQGYVSVWEGDMSGGSKLGEFGDALSSISEEPRRMDGNDLDGSAFVLHGDSYAGADSYKLSIFFDFEIPG